MKSFTFVLAVITRKEDETMIRKIVHFVAHPPIVPDWIGMLLMLGGVSAISMGAIGLFLFQSYGVWGTIGIVFGGLFVWFGIHIEDSNEEEDDFI